MSVNTSAVSARLTTSSWFLPSAASEERRLALLPRAAAPDWDALMVSERYMQALSLLPG